MHALATLVTATHTSKENIKKKGKERAMHQFYFYITSEFICMLQIKGGWLSGAQDLTLVLSH